MIPFLVLDLLLCDRTRWVLFLIRRLLCPMYRGRLKEPTAVVEASSC